MKLLLAEDDPQVRVELRELLSEEGYTVVTAADGIEAFERFRDDTDIELMLLDIRMPRCTGLQTLDAIRRIDSNEKRIYETIFITGNNDSEAVISALKLGAFSFLFKPIVIEQLLAEIEDAKDRINQRRYRRFREETLKAQVESTTNQITRLTDELRGGFAGAIELLARSAEYDVPGIDLHVVRIGDMAACLSARLGYNTLQQQQLRLAAMLHDVGKITGPRELYSANRKLTADEFEQTKGHTVNGAAFLAHHDEPVFATARVIAQQHHENYDGSGYPHGLSGDAITLDAAIVHAVDVYDNLRAQRPYRDPLPHYVALDNMVNGDDKSTPEHFHPKVLQALLSQHRDIEAIYERFRIPAVNTEQDNP